MARQGDALIQITSKRGNFITESALPKIHTARQLSEVVNMSQDGVCMEYPELWGNVSFAELMSTSDARKNNFDTIAEHYQHKLASQKRKRASHRHKRRHRSAILRRNGPL